MTILNISLATAVLRCLARKPAATTLAACALSAAAPSPAHATPPEPPSFFSFSRQAGVMREPRLGAAPDVVKAFGLDRSPDLFRQRPPTPDLPRLTSYDAPGAFPRRPYIPDLWGAEPCPERGPGFYRVKGTAACIHVGGRVGAGVQIGGKGQSGAFTYGRVQADVVTPTEIGDLTVSMGVQGVMSTQNVGPVYVGPRTRIIP